MERADAYSIYCISCFPFIVVVVCGQQKTRGRAVVGDPLAFLTVVMKNYYETIILFQFLVETQNLASGVLSF